MQLVLFFVNLARRILWQIPIQQIRNHFIFSLNNVRLPKNCHIRGVPYVNNLGTIKVGSGLVLNSDARANPVGGNKRTVIYVGKDASLVIGNNVGISSSTIVCHKSIILEDDVYIGAGCDIYDSDFHSIYYEDRIINGNKNVKSRAVLIRRGAWLGARVIVLKGVEIGEKAVIAAGSVITKSVPRGELWGGNPARFIRTIGFSKSDQDGSPV